MHISCVLWIWDDVCGIVYVCARQKRDSTIMGVCQPYVCVVLPIPAGSAVTKHFFLWARGQLLDTVKPHTYSNSLIHKSHRLTLGSPRCPDRWGQKPREESRQEEEEVSESWGREGEGETERSGVKCSPGPLTQCCVAPIKPEPLFILTKPWSFNYTNPIQLKWDSDLLSVKKFQSN